MKFRSALTGLALSISGAAAYAAEPVSEVTIPEVRTNGGLRFKSEGAGTPNTLSGYLFAPLSQSENGNVLFVDHHLVPTLPPLLTGFRSAADLSL